MMSKSNLLLVVTAVAALSAGFWLSSMQQSATEESAEAKKQKALEEARSNYTSIQGNILSPARKISIPSLVKDNGETFGMDDLTGHWSLFFFGYTHCPDICPVTMGVLSTAKKTAEAINHTFPQVVFVSVDPERDKLEMLSEYVRYFDEDFIGVTGEEVLIKAMTLQMSVLYMKVPGSAEDAEDGAYTVDHSSALLLLNPEGKLAAFLNAPHDPQTILKDFQTVVNKSN